MNSPQKDQIPEEASPALNQFFGKGGMLEKIRSLSRDTQEGIYALAHRLYEGNDYKQALSLFTFLTFCDHFEKKFVAGQAACMQMLKFYKEAIDAYSYLGRLDMEDPTTPLQAAHCWMALERYKEAASGFSAAAFLGKRKKDPELVKFAKAMEAAARKKLKNDVPAPSKQRVIKEEAKERRSST